MSNPSFPLIRNIPISRFYCFFATPAHSSTDNCLTGAVADSSEQQYKSNTYGSTVVLLVHLLLLCIRALGTW